MANIKDQSFTINVTGELTGENYAGAFKCRPALTHAQQLERDRLRREFLGNRPDGATERAQTSATIFAELAVRMTEAPRWWQESQNGMDLYDDNVVAEVYGQAMKVAREWMEEIQKRAADAKKDLEKATPKP